MKINIVSGGILKNSLIKMTDSRIFVYFSPSNEHFEISKCNCTAIKTIRSNRSFSKLSIIWATGDVSEITVDDKYHAAISGIFSGAA